MRFVLDNSVVMRWLFADGSDADRSYAKGVLERLGDTDCHALAPLVWPLEVANVLSRAERKGRLQEARSERFLRVLAGLGVAVDAGSAERSLTSVLDIARRHELSSYDASYLDLALHHGIPLATLDADLIRAAGKAGIPIFDVGTPALP